MPRKYTQEERDFIFENRHKGQTILSDIMDIPYESIRAFFKNNKIRSERNTRFSQNHNPWNAGRTGLRTSPKSEFKKGVIPHNTLTVGDVTIRKNCQGFKYKYVKISNRNWVLYQREVWRKNNGPIPKGYMIRFIDGDSMNCDILNLELMTLQENLIANANREKAQASTKIYWEEYPERHPAKNYTDTYIAGLISEGDKNLRQLILDKHMDLIQAKRLQLTLNKRINESN